MTTPYYYPDTTSYEAARNLFIEMQERPAFFQTSSPLPAAYDDGNPNLGFGYNLNAAGRSEASVVADLNTAKIWDTLSDAVKSAVSSVLTSYYKNKLQYTSQQVANMINATGLQFTFAQADQLFQITVPHYQNIVDNYLQDSQISYANSSIEIALVSFAYQNESLLQPTSLLGGGLLSALSGGDIGRAWVEIAFNSDGGKHDHAMRRTAEASLLYQDPTTGKIFSTDLAVSILQALTEGKATPNSLLLTSIAKDIPKNQVIYNNYIDTTSTTLDDYLVQNYLYVAQWNDSITSIEKNTGYDFTTLAYVTALYPAKVNLSQTDPNKNYGFLLHLPLASFPISDTTPLPTLPASDDFLFNPYDSKLYVIATPTGREAGQLIIEPSGRSVSVIPGMTIASALGSQQKVPFSQVSPAQSADASGTITIGYADGSTETITFDGSGGSQITDEFSSGGSATLTEDGSSGSAEISFPSTGTVSASVSSADSTLASPTTVDISSLNVTFATIRSSNFESPPYPTYVDSNITAQLSEGTFASVGVFGTDLNDVFDIGTPGGEFDLSSSQPSGTIQVSEYTGGTGGDYQDVPFTIEASDGNSIFDATVLASGKIYQPASAQLYGLSTADNYSLESGTLNFLGHVGDNLDTVVGVLNAANDPLADTLLGGISSISDDGPAAFSSPSNSLTIAPGLTDELAINVNTSESGLFLATANLQWMSHDNELQDVSAYSNLSSISLSGTLYNYASLGLALAEGPGSLTGSGGGYTYDLGTVQQSTDTGNIAVAFENVAPAGYSDELLIAPEYTSGGGPIDFTSIPSTFIGGGESADMDFSINTSSAGVFSENFIVVPYDYNDPLSYYAALPSQSFSITGTITGNDPVFTVDGAVETLSSAAQIGTTTEFDLADGGTLNVDTPVQSGLAINFTTQGNSLTIANPNSFGENVGSSAYSGPLLEQFSSGDAIDLSGLPYVEGMMSYSYEQDTGLLQISNGTQTATLFFGPGNTVVDDPFHLNPDGSGGTVLTNDAALCYCRGTSIRTLSGDVAIEHLAIGDLVLTQFGGFQPVKWIGRQSYARRFLQNNPGKLPIRITAGALGNGLPVHDLYVSPGHSMLLGDRLVLAKSLVNGVTISQDDCPEEVHYYQLEFESHDCILAEGAWSESYADGPGLRNQFHNVAEFHQLYPGYPEPTELRLCAPRPERGEALGCTLRPIVARASEGLTLGLLRGAIDLVTADRVIEGWAQDTRNPDLPVMLKVLLDDRVIHTGLACDYRDDLAKAGFGRGHCSFSFTLPEEIAAADLRRIRVVRATDGAELFESDYCRAMASAAA